MNEDNPDRKNKVSSNPIQGTSINDVMKRRDLTKVEKETYQTLMADFLLGGLCFTIGVLITVFTLSASYGPIIIAWGAILYGGARLIRGVSLLIKGV